MEADGAISPGEWGGVVGGECGADAAAGRWGAVAGDRSKCGGDCVLLGGELWAGRAVGVCGTLSPYSGAKIRSGKASGS